MAQVLAVPGDVRHGFINKGKFNHEFGRITGIAATTQGNILLCDYIKKDLILVDPLGIHLTTLNLDSEPYDMAITSQNIGYITQPNTRTVLQIDPDRMVVIYKLTSNNSVMHASAVPNSGRDIPKRVSCYFGLKSSNGRFYVIPVGNHRKNIEIASQTTNYFIDPLVVKFHAVDQHTIVSCIGGQSYIKYNKLSRLGSTNEEYVFNIATLHTPTDICSDNNGHIYVSGQGSNNIHRLTQDGKVIDIPLDSRHGVIQPVALCFNKNFTKLYIVNQWGKCVLVFDVI